MTTPLTAQLCPHDLIRTEVVAILELVIGVLFADNLIAAVDILQR